MDLLKELPSNFRYYLITAKTGEILILFYRHNRDFDSQNEECIVETGYLSLNLAKYVPDQAQTVKVTCNENESTINQFNANIVKYCNSRPNTKQVRIYNCSSIEYKLLFESKVFKAICGCTKDIYVEIGESGLRIPNTDTQLNKLYIQNGRLYPESTATIYTEEFAGLDCKFDVADKTNESHAFNIVITKKMSVNSIRQYAPIDMVISAGNMSASDFSNSKLTCCCYELFGQERMENNTSRPRISILGVKKVNIGEMMIDKETTYGSVMKVDRVTTLTIGSVNREVTDVSSGSFITIGRVGTVNLHQINYKITPLSTVSDDVSVVYFLPDNDSGLTRSVNIFFTNIIGVKGRTMNVVKLASCNVDKVFISDCTIRNGVNLLSYDERSKINRLNYNDCNIDGDNILFKHINNLSIVNTNITSSSDIIIESSNISISGGIWKFNKLTVTNPEFVQKVNFIGTEFIGSDISIENPKLDQNDNGVFYDTGSAFDVDSVTIDKYKSSFTDSNFRLNKLSVNTNEVLTLSGSRLYFTRGDVDIDCNGSLSGNIFTLPQNNDRRLNIRINDATKHLTTNPLTINGSLFSPVFDVTTNVPIKFTFEMFSNPKIYASYTKDVESQQKSMLTFKYYPEITHKVITNGAKYTSLSKYNDENGNLVYEMIKK